MLIAKKLEGQLKSHGLKLKSCGGRVAMVQKSLAAGLFLNAAYLSANGDYRTIKGDQTVHVHPMSFLNVLTIKLKYVIYVEILNTTKSYHTNGKIHFKTTDLVTWCKIFQSNYAMRQPSPLSRALSWR